MSLRSDWVKERKTYLGGSDAAAILGVHPYKTPYQVWVEKTTEYEQDESALMRFGTVFEPKVADMYVEQTGNKVKECSTIRHPQYPFIGGNPDRLLVDHPGILEIKTAGSHTASAWGVPGSDQVPRHNLIQGMDYLMLTNLEFVDFALFNRENCETIVYRAWRDMELESMIVERLVAWWTKHIINGESPEIDGSDSTSEYIKQKFPTSSGVVIAATPEISQELNLLCEDKANLSGLKKRATARENRIKDFMGEAESLMNALGSPVTWKNDAIGTQTDWESLYIGLIAFIGMTTEASLILEEAKRLKALFTTNTKGSRRFLVPQSLYKDKKK